MPHVTPLQDSDPRSIGRYQLAGRIAGLPAAGPVYLARSSGGGEVTVLPMGSELAGGSAARDRFAEEAAGARRVAPFCAARILDAGLDDGQPFLVSEYVAGPSLLEVVTTTGPLGTADLELVAIGAMTGLAAIHQAGLVHGSFGPEHLVIGPDGPRVIAFGVTPPYGPATPSADLLAWAQTVGFAAAGQPPDGSPPDGPDGATGAASAASAAGAVGAASAAGAAGAGRTRRAGAAGDPAPLPPRLRRLVADCLSPAPAARPQARQVLRELLGPGEPPAGLLAEGARRASAAASLARTAGGPSRAAADGQPRQPAGRGGRLWWTAAAVVVVLAVAAAGIREIQNDSRPDSPAARGHGRPGASATARPSRPDDSPSVTPTSPAAASPAAGPTGGAVPRALAGSWSGQVSQGGPGGGPADRFGVRVVLRSGASTGTIAYTGSSFTCAGSLSVTSATASQLGLRQQIITGRRNCADGTVRVALKSPGVLLFTFRGAAGPQASGTLRA
jgi:hypothetical protein